MGNQDNSAITRDFNHFDPLTGEVHLVEGIDEIRTHALQAYQDYHLLVNDPEKVNSLLSNLDPLSKIPLFTVSYDGEANSSILHISSSLIKGHMLIQNDAFMQTLQNDDRRDLMYYMQEVPSSYEKPWMKQIKDTILSTPPETGRFIWHAIRQGFQDELSADDIQLFYKDLVEKSLGFNDRERMNAIVSIHENKHRDDYLNTGNIAKENVEMIANLDIVNHASNLSELRAIMNIKGAFSEASAIYTEWIRQTSPDQPELDEASKSVFFLRLGSILGSMQVEYELENNEEPPLIIAIENILEGKGDFFTFSPHNIGTIILLLGSNIISTDEDDSILINFNKLLEEEQLKLIPQEKAQIIARHIFRQIKIVAEVPEIFFEQLRDSNLLREIEKCRDILEGKLNKRLLTLSKPN